MLCYHHCVCVYGFVLQMSTLRNGFISVPHVLRRKLKMQCYEHLFSESYADYFSCSVHICEILCSVSFP